MICGSEVKIIMNTLVQVKTSIVEEAARKAIEVILRERSADKTREIDFIMEGKPSFIARFFDKESMILTRDDAEKELEDYVVKNPDGNHRWLYYGEADKLKAEGLLNGVSFSSDETIWLTIEDCNWVHRYLKTT